jgi:hypothetical protein
VAPAAAEAASLLGEAATTADAPAAPAAVEPPKPPAEIELKLPEGFKPDEEGLAAFKADAKELGLDSAKAQKLFDRYVALEAARGQAQAKAQAERDAKWTAEIQADPEIGGEKSEAAKADIRRALAKFGGAKMAQALHAAGLGNHPDLVRGFVAIGKAFAEDSIAGTAQAAGSAQPEKSLRELMYPTMDHSSSGKRTPT